MATHFRALKFGHMESSTDYIANILFILVTISILLIPIISVLLGISILVTRYIKKQLQHFESLLTSYS
jgi:hypothetical protein